MAGLAGSYICLIQINPSPSEILHELAKTSRQIGDPAVQILEVEPVLQGLDAPFHLDQDHLRRISAYAAESLVCSVKKKILDACHVDTEHFTFTKQGKPLHETGDNRAD